MSNFYGLLLYCILRAAFLLNIFLVYISIQLRRKLIKEKKTGTRMYTKSYLGRRLIWVMEFRGLDSITLLSTDEAKPLSNFLVQLSKHCFSSMTTWPMVGLWVDLWDTQLIANSTVFHAELTSKFPCNLGSTILLMSPFTSTEVNHWLIWILLLDLSMTGWPVIICNNTTPKLKTSLFSFNLFDV